MSKDPITRPAYQLKNSQPTPICSSKKKKNGDPFRLVLVLRGSSSFLLKGETPLQGLLEIKDTLLRRALPQGPA